MQEPKRHFTMLTFRSIVNYTSHRIILTGKSSKKKKKLEHEFRNSELKSNM